MYHGPCVLNWAPKKSGGIALTPVECAVRASPKCSDPEPHTDRHSLVYHRLWTLAITSSLWSCFLTWAPIKGGFVTFPPHNMTLFTYIFTMQCKIDLILGSFKSLVIPEGKKKMFLLIVTVH